MNDDVAWPKVSGNYKASVIVRKQEAKVVAHVKKSYSDQRIFETLEQYRRTEIWRWSEILHSHNQEVIGAAWRLKRAGLYMQSGVQLTRRDRHVGE